MLPEEEELLRMETVEAALLLQLAAAELESASLKLNVIRFQDRYHALVGRLFARKTALDAEISRAQAAGAAPDPAPKARARTSGDEAHASAGEAGGVGRASRPDVARDLKQAYRKAVKLTHPDLSHDEADRLRRTKLMSEINIAHERGDRGKIETLMSDLSRDPAAIVGDDIASRIIRTIRSTARLRRRVADIQGEMAALRQTGIAQLKARIEEAEQQGDDPLEKLAQQLAEEISERVESLRAMRSSAPASTE